MKTAWHRAAAIAVLIGMSQTGCSLATYRRPADPTMTLYEPALETCTNSIAPFADVGGAVFTGAAAAYMLSAAVGTQYTALAVFAVAPLLGLTALFAYSAWYGFQVVGTCDESPAR